MKFNPRNYLIWHPCTQMKDHEEYPLIKIVKGEGVYLYDDKGNRYIDAISSWWVNILGHSNERLNEALKRQVDRLEHVIFANFVHEPALKLTDKLLRIAPKGLSKVFFADNGSSAIEVAMKMSFGYFKNKGKIKNKFVYLDCGYHGETLGALSVCGEELYSQMYKEIMIENIKVKGPDCFRCPFGKTRENCNVECFSFMEEALVRNKDTISAVLIEPIVNCAGGFKIYPPIYLKKLRDLTQELDIHLIADEIAVGFGRTGKMFACEHAGITPDFMCLSKGLTGGYMPLSVVLTNDEIYDTFYGDYVSLKAFLHSHSYTGNPLGCALASEVLDIFEEDDLLNKNRSKQDRLKNRVIEKFSNYKYCGEVRSIGFITAVELVKDKITKEPFNWKERLGFKIYRNALKKGALLRNLGDVIYFMPPYVITKKQIDELVNIAFDSVVEVLGE
ncbi:adenosylmethionine--8-amino-7-oxononanoate transaminase [Hippea maritima]|uniref:Adenosylmethionine-8-amino-7-oxononanoate aminotransferase n=1 Tax=Hippea maritima (strain ATCC 700847 / DSM 10411 / MH2) TaxID=760142 RepID=F2LTY5_HIPMA|nr:adenosylmethionine--8-amino-7-oxononanoate transaminase [Hippea maritima]AEA33384.1 adenosylmethionine-8-amino-7-oxononanoate aminotransferase [Hippea maritima DSM 10411]